MTFEELTDRQNEMLNVILLHITEHKSTPTFRYLMEKMGYSSPHSVSQMLSVLARKKFLVQTKVKHNSGIKIGPMVPDNLLIKVGGKICIVNAKWKMTNEEALELSECLEKMASNVADSADTTGREPVHVGSEDQAPPA